MQLAADGEIDREKFESRVIEITLAALLLALIMGSRLVLDAIEFTPQIGGALQRAEAQARQSARNLANDIYVEDRYAPQDDETPADVTQRRESRAAMWAATMAGMYAFGQTWRQDDPFLRWQVGPTEHCSDCNRLNGQVHRASEWRASGWQPQSSRLECSGYRCQCYFTVVDGPSSGGF
jgi:hypothetical protein